MKLSLRLVGALLGSAATVYFLVFAYRTITRYEIENASGTMIAAIAVASIAYAATIPISSWAWSQLLRRSDKRLSLLTLNMIMGVTQIAKYVPGNVGQHLGRSTMSAQRGLPAHALLISMAAEMALVITAGVGVGVLGLVLSGLGTGTLGLRVGHMATLAVLGFAITIGGALSAGRLLPWLGRRYGLPLAATADAMPRLGSLAAAFAAYALIYVLIGTTLYIMASTTTFVQPALLPACIGIFALSWIAGFLFPGAPAGLGVREGVMAAFLSPQVGSTSALYIIVGFRIATTLGDLFGLAWGGALYFHLKRADERGRAAAPADREISA